MGKCKTGRHIGCGSGGEGGGVDPIKTTEKRADLFQYYQSTKSREKLLSCMKSKKSLFFLSLFFLIFSIRLVSVLFSLIFVLSDAFFSSNPSSYFLPQQKS